MVGLGDYSLLKAEDFNFSVSYDEIQSAAPNLKIKILKQPPYITDLKSLPEVAEYIIEKR